MRPARAGAASPAVAPFPSLTLQESELSLQAIIDPYARADFFLAIGEAGIEVEEGYVTFPTLPGGLLGQSRQDEGGVRSLEHFPQPYPSLD